jgi:invasion protein IalB
MLSDDQIVASAAGKGRLKMNCYSFLSRNWLCRGLSIFFLASLNFCLFAVPSPAAQPIPNTSVAAPAPKLFAQVYGNWVYRCAVPSQPTANGHASCEVVQPMVFNQGNKSIPLMTLAFTHGANGTHVMNLVAPLGVLLAPGIAVSVDQEQPVLAAYAFCDAAGCWSVDQPAATLLDQMRRGTQGHAKFVLLTGRTVTVNFSLSGLTSAATALDSGVPPKEEIKPAS